MNKCNTNSCANTVLNNGQDICQVCFQAVIDFIQDDKALDKAKAPGHNNHIKVRDQVFTQHITGDYIGKHRIIPLKEMKDALVNLVEFNHSAQWKRMLARTESPPLEDGETREGEYTP